MLQIKKGNIKAFDELYTRYSTKLLHFFYKKLYQDIDKANDFLQDLFVKIIEKPELFNQEKSFKTWIYTIAYNMCKNEYRNNSIKNTQVIDFNASCLKELPIFNKFINKYDTDLFTKSLNNELNKMNNNHSKTFILKHKELLSIKEIANIMSCSEGTVKSRLFYTTKHLAQKLQIFNKQKEVYYEN